jgi:TET-Associated Glycosyltransferase
MEIYIPTRGRVFQETWSSLPKELQQVLYFVVPHNQTFIAGSGVLRTPPEIDGIGPTRQWIIDHALARNASKAVMLDDDLVFATRREDDPTKFRNSTAEDITLLFNDIEHYLNSFAHVGVATREGGNRDTSHTVVNTRLLRILAYRTDILRNRNIRFDRVELMEDFDVTLQLLEQGYPNVKINWIAHNQRSSNAPGGCSTYRTIEKQGLAAERLQQLHPRFVAVVTKQTKTAWNGKERQDVRIAWKNAFDSARTTAILDSGTEPGDAQEGPGPTKTME